MKKFIITIFCVFSIFTITKATENYYMFKSTFYTVSSGNFYDGEGPLNDYLDNQDVIVTLFPATTGAKISVTFNSFHTQTNYTDEANRFGMPVNDILYVYNGNNISAPQIGAMQGFGYGTVTSTAIDGSLTFKFVSHTPYYTPDIGSRAGWSATIACNYTPTDITMISGSSFTTCGGNFFDAGGPNGDYMNNQNEITPSGGSVVTLYPATPGAKISVTFNSFHSQTNYTDEANRFGESVNDILYVYNGNNITAPQIGAIQGQAGYGTITSTAIDGSLTFKFVSHTPYYTPDIGSRAGWSATIACNYTPTDITMIASGAFKTSGGNFYDSGGPSGDYVNNQSDITPSGGSVVTLYPATPGAKISVTFNSFHSQTNYTDVANRFGKSVDDILYIYDGNSIAAPPIGALKGLESPRTYNSTATDGSLTFKFVSHSPYYTPNAGTRAGWSATIAGNMNSTVYVNPNLFISAPQVKPGQSITFSGKQFSQAGKVNLDFTGPGTLNLITDYSIDVSGNFNYTLTIPTTQAGGSYQVTATDKISGISRTRSFQIIQNQSTIVDDYLRIVEPNMSKIRLVGDPITLAWEDQVKFNVNPLYNLKHSYKVEYKKDANNSSGTWQFVEDVKGTNPGYGKINASTSFTPTDAGTYVFRISDNYYPNRSATTPELVVSGSLNQDIRVELKWDYNSKDIGTSPEGVAADGVARFYMVVSNSNPLSSAIQKVKVSISDPEEYTSTQFLGKLMKCSYQSDDKYKPEADNANSTSAENNTPNSNGQYWFWYVAPDDFSRNQGDWDKGERKVAVNFEIFLANGKTIPSFKKEITIVRPPLMLVHGLNGAPDSWDKFHLGIENPLYINDQRFKIKKAAYMLPTAHFNVNSSTLLAGSEIKNSFMWYINEMRKKGYACSQVDYICHSMGGSIFRDAVENTASYKRENNYKKGFVNKCITINTPHQGSSFANVLEDVSKVWLLTGPIISMGAISNLYEINFLNIKVVDAVEDLRFKNGIKFNITDVPSHLIGGGISCREFNTFTSSTYKFLKNYLGIMTFSNFLDLYSWYNLYFELRGYESDFMDSSDAVVSLTSQFSGYTGNTLPVFYTRTSGTMHNSTFGVSPMASSDIWKRVNELLNTKENSLLFNSMPSTKVSGTKSAPYTPKQTLAIIEDRIKIFYPSQNTVYQAGDTMTIKLKVDTTGMKSFAMFFQDQSFFEKPTKTNLEFKLIVSPEYIEGQSISVIGSYSNSGVSTFSNASIDLKVKPVGSIIDFNVTPEVIMIEKSKSRRPDYEAIFPNAIAQIGQTDQLIVKINDSSLLTYDNATNQFKGLAKGSTQATITYKEITKTVFFEIIQYEEPVGDPISGIDDIRLDKKDQLNAKVYPNPVTNELTIELEGNTQKVDFEIINSLGQSVFSGVILEKTVVQTTNFTSGIYLIKLKSGTTFEFKKVIKE